MTVRRVCFFSHYDRRNLLAPETRHYLSELASAGYRIVVISNSGRMDFSARLWLRRRGIRLLARRNAGLDFGAWSFALKQTQIWRDADWLLLANDSVFGPLRPLAPILARLENSGADFFGLTDNLQIAPHIQSYFLGFSAKVLAHPVFAAHFAQDFETMPRARIIAEGEVALTARLEEAGFKSCIAFPFSEVDDGTVRGDVAWPPNMLHDHWDRLVRDFGFPFIKVELLRDNPLHIPGTAQWRKLISSPFQADWIDHHLRSVPRRKSGLPVTLVHDLPAPFGSPQLGLSIHPLNFRIDPALADRPTLNVLMGAMALEHMAGGQNSAIQIAARLADAGVPIRFLSTQAPTDHDHETLYRHIAMLTGRSDRAMIAIGDGYDRTVPQVIGPKDNFLATAWWTAHIAKAALPLVGARRFLYFIQDVETGFHAADSFQALAAETYRFDSHPIVNQSFLADHLRRHVFGDRPMAVLAPALDAKHFFADSASLMHRRGRRLLFYARPQTAPRNLYPTGLAALRLAAHRGAFEEQDWTFNFIGDPLPDCALAEGRAIRFMPRRDFADYAALMRETDICLALMLSPHTGYPVLEAAACGALGVTNSFSVKTAEALAALSPNIIAAAPEVDAIAEALIEAARRAGDVESRLKAARIDLPRNWDDAYAQIENKLLEFWRDCLKDRP